MGGPHASAYPCERGCSVDDAFADQRVSAHELLFLGIEWPGLVQDAVGDRDLADIVQVGGAHQFCGLRFVEAVRSADAGGERGHVVDVVVEF
jgi:hypothetical protein